MKHTIFNILIIIFLSNCNQVAKKQEEGEDVYPKFSTASFKKHVVDSIILPKIDGSKIEIDGIEYYRNKNDSTDFIGLTEDSMSYFGYRKYNYVIKDSKKDEYLQGILDDLKDMGELKKNYVYVEITTVYDCYYIDFCLDGRCEDGFIYFTFFDKFKKPISVYRWWKGEFRTKSLYLYKNGVVYDTIPGDF